MPKPLVRLRAAGSRRFHSPPSVMPVGEDTFRELPEMLGADPPALRHRRPCVKKGGSDSSSATNGSSMVSVEGSSAAPPCRGPTRGWALMQGRAGRHRHRGTARSQRHAPDRENVLRMPAPLGPSSSQRADLTQETGRGVGGDVPEIRKSPAARRTGAIVRGRWPRHAVGGPSHPCASWGARNPTWRNSFYDLELRQSIRRSRRSGQRGL